MKNNAQEDDEQVTQRRFSKAERRRQLLDTALLIVREEGADRLTLGHLAARAGVSKPVAYDHFGTRSGLLIEALQVDRHGAGERVPGGDDHR
ncbi:TetR/AcrR family transcriptional regulator [Pseudoroseomonas wenyumeiae]